MLHQPIRIGRKRDPQEEAAKFHWIKSSPAFSKTSLVSSFEAGHSWPTAMSRLTADQSTTSEREPERPIATADFVDEH
jgi:hypothetical protein